LSIISTDGIQGPAATGCFQALVAVKGDDRTKIKANLISSQQVVRVYFRKAEWPPRASYVLWLAVSSVQDLAVAVDQLPIDSHRARLIWVGHIEASGLAVRDANHAERDAIDNGRWRLFLSLNLSRLAKDAQGHQSYERDEHRRDR
jgi:hypothetical protein